MTTDGYGICSAIGYVIHFSSKPSQGLMFEVITRGTPFPIAANHDASPGASCEIVAGVLGIVHLSHQDQVALGLMAIDE